MQEPRFPLRQLGKKEKGDSFLARMLHYGSSVLAMLWQTIEHSVLLLWKSHRYLLLCIIVALLFAWIVPYNTDEFIHYHALLCHAYPFNALNTFTGACGGLDLNLLNTGWILPLRAYLYSGSFPSLYYLPLFWLWPSPISARLLNVFLLLLQSIVLAKLFRLKTWHVFLGLLLFFPYAFQHIVDTGPVAFQILTVYLCALLFDRWMERPVLRYPLIIAVLLFLAIWTKLIFFALLPGIAILFLLAVWRRPPATANFIVQFLGGTLLFLALMAALLLSSSPSDPSVYPLLQQFFEKGGQYGLREFFNVLPHLTVTKALLNPLVATHRIYDVWPVAESGLVTLYIALLYLSVPLLCTWALRIKELRKAAQYTLLTFALFPLTFFLIAHTKITWAMHHAILAFPFLILAALGLLSMLLQAQSAQAVRLKKTMLGMLGFFVALNLFWFALFPAQAVQSSDDPSKVRINALLHNDNAAQGYFFVITDWGMYFYQGLYGAHDQSVLYMNGIYRQEEFAALKKLSLEHRRKMLFIVNAKAKTTDLALIRTHFSLTRCAALSEHDAWQVWYETGAMDGICDND